MNRPSTSLLGRLSTSLLGRLAVVTFAATTATAGLASVAGADGEVVGHGRIENARLRADLGYAQAANRELRDGLDRIERTSARSSDRRTRFAVQRIVDDTRERADRYVSEPGHPGRPGDRPHPGTPGNPGWPTQPSRPMLSDTDMASLTARLSNSFPSDQVEQVRTLSRSMYVTVDQVIAIMKTSGFDSTRIEIAVLLYPRVVDQHRWFTVDDALDFSSSRATLRKRLGL